MWRKHPLARLITGLTLALTAVAVIGSALLWLGQDFWEDGRQAPVQTQGVIRGLPRLSTSTKPNLIKVFTGAEQVEQFELRNSVVRQLDIVRQGNAELPVTVNHSPILKNVYTITAAGRLIVQDDFDPVQLFQAWQRIPAYVLLMLSCVGLAGMLFALLALLDLLLPLRRVQGALVARLETAEAYSGGLSIIVRPWENTRPGRQLHFELSEPDFLITDGVDFVEVTYHRLFRYVRRLRPLTLDDLPGGARQSLAGLSAEGLNLRYAPGWQTLLLLYSDGLMAALLVGMAAAMLLGYWLPEITISRGSAFDWVLLPMFAGLFLTIAVFLLVRFRSRLLDLRAPKRVIRGPVLSKWRVTGSSNNNRRLIVVADGGLSAGEKGVCRFDLTPAVFDQLQVGDIIEIEHTPQLRFICRLEVKGHQELTRSHPA